MNSVQFTPREEQVIDGLFKAKTNKEIANDYGIQEVTVKLHMRNVGKKLNAKNRTDVVLQVLRKGYRVLELAKHS